MSITIRLTESGSRPISDVRCGWRQEIIVPWDFSWSGQRSVVSIGKS